MKKIYYITLLAAIAATTASCTKQTPDSPVMRTISVKLGSPEIEDATRTVLVNDSHIYWTAADKNIACITTDGSFYALSSTESGQAATKTFTGSIPADKEVKYYYYDRNRSSGWQVTWKGNGLLREILDSSQPCATAGSFHVGLNYAIAKPGDGAFKSVHGFFKWTNNGNAIKSVRFETLTAGEYLAGYFDVTYNDAQPQTSKFYYNEANATACSPFVLSTVSASSIPADKSYYAIVIPGTYHGLKVTITLADSSSFILKTTEIIVVERGKYIDFGVLPVEPVSIVTGDFTLSTGQDFEQGWTMDF